VAQDMPLIPARPTGIRTRRNALLTPRQREVLQLLAEGKRTKEIAGLLFVSSRTVEFHKYKMMEELGMGSTAELVRYAVKHRIVAV
jgi:DNA-binding NarL/FixJ family response regulator